MSGIKEYLAQCLVGIPKSKYRDRLLGELLDHLELLAGDLRATGYNAEDAQAEALRQLGDATALNKEYRSGWIQQPERLYWDIRHLLFGVLISGLGYLIGVALIMFGDVILGILRIIIGAKPQPTLLLTILHYLDGAVLFFAAFIPNAFFLRKTYRWREHRANLIICGLLLSWIVGKGIAMLYLFTTYNPDPLIDSLRIAAHMFACHYNSLWFTWPFIASSLIGCIAMGLLFSRSNGEMAVWMKTYEKS